MWGDLESSPVTRNKQQRPSKELLASRQVQPPLEQPADDTLAKGSRTSSRKRPLAESTNNNSSEASKNRPKRQRQHKGNKPVSQTSPIWSIKPRQVGQDSLSAQSARSAKSRRNHAEDVPAAQTSPVRASWELESPTRNIRRSGRLDALQSSPGTALRAFISEADELIRIDSHSQYSDHDRTLTADLSLPIPDTLRNSSPGMKSRQSKDSIYSWDPNFDLDLSLELGMLSDNLSSKADRELHAEGHFANRVHTPNTSNSLPPSSPLTPDGMDNMGGELSPGFLRRLTDVANQASAAMISQVT